MDSLVEYVAIYANILVRSKELDELRERLEKAKARRRDAGSTETEAGQLLLTDSRV
jgi:hypothetical protein